MARSEIPSSSNVGAEDSSCVVSECVSVGACVCGVSACVRACVCV